MNCERCGAPTSVHMMSMFNTEAICMTCKRAERRHPRYAEACQAEEEASRRGDVNFPGIGLPDDLIGGGHHLLRGSEVDPARVVQPPRDPDRPGANGVYHIAGDEATLCGRACAGWHRPFRATGPGRGGHDCQEFSAPCVEAYAEEPEGETGSRETQESCRSRGAGDQHPLAGLRIVAIMGEEVFQLLSVVQSSSSNSRLPIARRRSRRNA